MGDEYGGAMQAHHVPRQGVMQRGHHAQQHQALDVDPTLYPMYAADPAFYPYVMQQDVRIFSSFLLACRLLTH